MATIEERQNEDGTIGYRVKVRTKKENVSKTFFNRVTAEMWGRYKEDLINDMEAFDVTASNLITLKDAIEMKVKELTEKNMSNRHINDVKMCSDLFPEMSERSISCLSYEYLLAQVNEMLSAKVRVGGSSLNKGSGRLTLSSPSTVLRKFRALSSVISPLIEMGINIENHPLKIVQYLRSKIKDSDQTEEE